MALSTLPLSLPPFLTLSNVWCSPPRAHHVSQIFLNNAAWKRNECKLLFKRWSLVSLFFPFVSPRVLLFPPILLSLCSSVARFHFLHPFTHFFSRALVLSSPLTLSSRPFQFALRRLLSVKRASNLARSPTRKTLTLTAESLFLLCSTFSPFASRGCFGQLRTLDDFRSASLPLRTKNVECRECRPRVPCRECTNLFKK